jgi:hypothetical protein
MTSMTSWTGKKGTNWFEKKNWSKGIPSANLHAHIPANPEGENFPIIKRKLSVDFTLKNDGKFENEGLIEIKENGLFQNEGSFENFATGTFTNSGNSINSGEIINSGTIDNSRIFTNSGSLHNEGLIENQNTVVNLGDCLNTGRIDNFSLISNSGTLENYNIIENKGDGKIENKGFIPEELINDFSAMEYTASSIEALSQQNINT